MGRKVSLNERAATEAFRAVLDSTKNEKLRMKAAQLLLDNEIRNKDRAVARQRQKLSNTQNTSQKQNHRYLPPPSIDQSKPENPANPREPRHGEPYVEEAHVQISEICHLRLDARS